MMNILLESIIIYVRINPDRHASNAFGFYTLEIKPVFPLTSLTPQDLDLNSLITDTYLSLWFHWFFDFFYISIVLLKKQNKLAPCVLGMSALPWHNYSDLFTDYIKWYTSFFNTYAVLLWSTRTLYVFWYLFSFSTAIWTLAKFLYLDLSSLLLLSILFHCSILLSSWFGFFPTRTLCITISAFYFRIHSTKLYFIYRTHHNKIENKIWQSKPYSLLKSDFRSFSLRKHEILIKWNLKVRYLEMCVYGTRKVWVTLVSIYVRILVVVRRYL